MSVTDQELIRLRNAGQITFDKQVSIIVDELLGYRQRERLGPCWCPYCGEPHSVARRAPDASAGQS